MIILLHSSKTMHSDAPVIGKSKPKLTSQAEVLNAYLSTLSPAQLMKYMQVNEKLAEEVAGKIVAWQQGQPTAAIDTFLGDIYSGLQVPSWSEDDRTYAQEHLRILSGLYGVLRPLDGIRPYRLEMGYRLPDPKFSNLYDYWVDGVAKTMKTEKIFLNLAAVEYSKIVTKYLTGAQFISPKFLTVNPETKQPVFVVVHAKIARGAFARWVIQNRIESTDKLEGFNELGYRFDEALSTESEPVFVCQEFKGLGLSVRLKKNG